MLLQCAYITKVEFLDDESLVSTDFIVTYIRTLQPPHL